MRRKIVSWLKKQVRLARAKGIVLGLSGGLDSCVTAALAAQALGADQVLGLVMPCHSHGQDRWDALKFSRGFNIQTKVIDLSEAYDSLLRVLPRADQLTRANIRPRLRMIVLYYFARKMNYLVCGTSNKSERMSGYFTKFGDGACDIMPLGNLYKTQVRKLAVELGIPDRIIDKPPTAGLWPGQTDEDDLGISYAELDRILGGLEKKRTAGLSRSKIKHVKRMVRVSEHKRQKPAMC